MRMRSGPPEGVVGGLRVWAPSGGSWTGAAQGLDLRPEGRPEWRHGFGEDQGHAAGRDEKTSAAAQNALAQAAQALRRAGRVRHGAAGHMHSLVGQHCDQQPHLVAGKGIDGRRRRLRLSAAQVGLRPFGRGQG